MTPEQEARTIEVLECIEGHLSQLVGQLDDLNENLMRIRNKL